MVTPGPSYLDFFFSCYLCFLVFLFVVIFCLVFSFIKIWFVCFVLFFAFLFTWTFDILDAGATATLLLL